MSKVKDSTTDEAEEEFSVEKVLDRRIVKGKVCKILLHDISFNIKCHFNFKKIVWITGGILFKMERIFQRRKHMGARRKFRLSGSDRSV